MKNLEGKVAVVTGSGRGIGRAIALELAERGATVAVAEIVAERSQQVADEIAAAGGQALPVVMDITNSKIVNEKIGEVLEKLGKIDILVNNAGWDKLEPFIKTQEETWDKIIAINLRGPITVTRAVLGNMIERGYGKIVTISSDAGRVGSSGESVYSACKGGLIAFTKTLARELARKKINVNTVCPGPTDTPLFSELGADIPNLLDALKKAVPMGRLGRPEDVAHAVAFLASDDAEFITGQTLSVSGGLTMC